MKNLKLKKILGTIVLGATLLSLAACASPNANYGATATAPPTESEAEPVTLTVFAAASMTETLTQVANAYKTVMPNVTILLNFDSSGTLQTQIEEGAECDLFISAAPKQMDALDRSKDAAANDFVDQGTRVNLLENKVVLVVPSGNPKGVKNFNDLAEKLINSKILLAMGNSDVPVGQYTQKIFTYYGLDETQLAGKGAITYGSNVKEVTTQVKEASVDCGVIYATDAFSAGLTVVDSATAEMCGQVIYPAAALKNSKDKDAAKAFLAYLMTDESVKTQT
jgi:molybdate transport system substrate-binding protein